MTLKSFLPQVGLFRGLSEGELAKLEGLCRTDSRGPGELIFKEGDKAEDVCVVMEGQAELRFELPGRDATDEHTMSVVPPGKAFGWSALVPPYELTLSVYAGDEGCRFFRMNGKRLNEFFEEHNRIGFVCFRNLTHVVAKRFHALEEECVSDKGRDVMHKW